MTKVQQGLLCILLSVPLIACQPSKADDGSYKNPHPGRNDLAQALNAKYLSGPKGRQECLGRLTFNLDKPVKWALSSSTTTPKDQMPIISREIRSEDEGIDYGTYGLYVLIYPGATQQQLDAQYESAVDEKIYVKREHEESIAINKRRLDKLKKSSSATRDPNITQEQHDRAIAELEEELVEEKQVLANVGKASHPMDFGMTDRKGYAQGRYLQGYLLRDGVYYHFVMGGNLNDKRTDAQREAWFTDFMKRFQTRKLYDIPKERGVCIPYGFIPDDGTVPFKTAAGIRFDDRPNVLYTLRTQVVDERLVTNTLLAATTRASVGLMAGFANQEVAKLVKKRIGPHRAYIGELAAEQGGTVVQLTEGKRKFDNYSVFTGYNGWMNSQVLPFIAVDMRSFTQAETRDSEIERLKTDPPPFEESKSRLDALLKSIRLRPTTPAMAELEYPF
ncbi:T6SS immunity protein Tli4 family protein [Aquabacterium sp.]|uniref:T6SS immunity protein Tli4 family protein n=1 Tax=Aquabacterium sp. TaxID=1872578 RepID=UPI003D6D7C97